MGIDTSEERPLWLEASWRLWNLYSKVYTLAVRRKFKRLESYLDPRVLISNPQNIAIGRNVDIRPYTWIYAIRDDGLQRNRFQPSISVGNGCNIGRFCHITASNRLILEENVFVTEGVLITDSIHGYEDTTRPILHQPLVSLGPIVIGAGSWIGNGARVIGKVSIGKNCVVGANSVVKDCEIADFSVVVGMPGRVVRRFDSSTSQWRRTDVHGQFV